MTAKISVDYLRDGKTVSYEAKDILRLVRKDKPLAELDGELVRVNAPQHVIDLIQHVPGGEVVDDSGVITSAATLEGQLLILLLSAAVGLGYHVGFSEGFEDAQEAGGDAAGEGDDDDEGEGDGEGGGSGQDAGDGEGERVAARTHQGGAQCRRTAPAQPVISQASTSAVSRPEAAGILAVVRIPASGRS